MNIPFSPTRTFRVAVEGNIGSGKSTFLEHCRQHEDFEVVSEPVEEWTDANGFNLLEKFYTDPMQWSMAFQSFVSLTFVRRHLQLAKKPIRMTERSIFSSRHCFVQNMLENGYIAPGMVSVLNEWYDFVDQTFSMRPDAIVYLQTTSSVAYERIVSRGRREESGISLTYVEQLHRLHNEWISRETTAMVDGSSATTVLVLDGDLHFDQLVVKYNECLEKTLTHGRCIVQRSDAINEEINKLIRWPLP